MGRGDLFIQMLMVLVPAALGVSAALFRDSVPRRSAEPEFFEPSWRPCLMALKPQRLRVHPLDERYWPLGRKQRGVPTALVTEAREPMVTAGVRIDAVRASVREQIVGLRACYEVDLRRDPTVQGVVAVDLWLSADGTVVPAIVESTVGSLPLEQCIVSAAKNWIFGAPAAGAAAVRYSFDFRRVE